MTACHYHNLPWCRLSGCIITGSVSCSRWRFSSCELMDRYSSAQSVHRASPGVQLVTQLKVGSLFVAGKVSSDVSSTPLTAERWQVAHFLQPVCLSIPTCLSLPKLSEAARANLSGRWGPAFSVSHRQHNLWPTMQRVWTSQCPNGESMQCHARPRFSEESLSVSTFCWAPSEELCIFYLSLEIRLDPDENIGLRAQIRRLARTHIHSRARKWASFCCWKSRQLWREMGGTVGICICRWEKKLHLPQGSVVEMNQLSMVCRSDPIL